LSTDEIIVLACSRKFGGKCVAGISRESGEWVRPVSAYQHGQLDGTQTRVAGRQVKLLDVVRVYHEGLAGNPAQPENVVLSDHAWELTDMLDPEMARAELADHIMGRGPLFGNRGQAVPAEQAAEGLDASIALIEPPEEVAFRTRRFTGSISPRAVFAFSGRELNLAITDEPMRATVLKAGDGEHSLADLGIDCDHTIMTISLAEPKGEWCSKLVAGFPFFPNG
jgi:hypothetical protein